MGVTHMASTSRRTVVALNDVVTRRVREVVVVRKHVVTAEERMREAHRAARRAFNAGR